MSNEIKKEEPTVVERKSFKEHLADIGHEVMVIVKGKVIIVLSALTLITLGVVTDYINANLSVILGKKVDVTQQEQSTNTETPAQSPTQPQVIVVQQNQEKPGNARQFMMPNYYHDETKNILGPHRCETHADCDGARMCSAFGWCHGSAREGDDPSMKKYTHGSNESGGNIDWNDGVQQMTGRTDSRLVFQTQNDLQNADWNKVLTENSEFVLKLEDGWWTKEIKLSSQAVNGSIVIISRTASWDSFVIEGSKKMLVKKDKMYKFTKTSKGWILNN